MFRYLVLVLLALLGCSTPIECRDETCSQDDDQMHGAVPLVQVLPKKGWAQGDTFQPGTGKNVSVLQQSPLPEAGNYTLQFNVTDLNDATNLFAGDVIKAQAIITWKVNGNPVTRIVDVGNGVSITGVAEAVDVNIQDVSTPPAIINRGRPYTVTVTCAPGTRPTTNQPPTVALPITAIVPGTFVDFNVPSGAISVFVAISPTVLGGTIGAYQVIVTQQNFGGPTVLKTYDPRQSDWVPLAVGTQVIRVRTDVALAQNTNVQVTFGIDG